MLGVGYGAEQLGWNAIAPADDPHSDPIGDAACNLRDEVPTEQPHEERDLSRRASPVVGGERIQGERPDSAGWCGLHDLPHRAGPLDVAGRAHLAARHGPSPVAIHDYRDVNAAWRVLLHQSIRVNPR